ncbi:ankyrin repeat-containing domain protein [Achaetomium macrosporum]|uniref:protein S-acyltransferase n=1 Tax=Achaetomium macrosporum TaxID=79813 RepID=A0AAN7HDQ9_9PEZI|nr:ankyrin repeat-containing domain protein [Achaetomium macrosporum]
MSCLRLGPPAYSPVNPGRPITIVTFHPNGHLERQAHPSISPKHPLPCQTPTRTLKRTPPPSYKPVSTETSPSSKPSSPKARTPTPPATGYYGRTPLQAASLAGHLPLVRALLAAGGDVNAPGGNNGGLTALALAARAGHADVVEMLLAHGADVHLPAARYMGRTALQAACEGGQLGIVRRLLDSEGGGVERMVNAPAAWDSGRTALQAAAQGGFGEVVELLLEKGAEVNTAPLGGYKGVTALQAAAISGSVEEVVERLIAAGAEVNAEGSRYNGGTAFDEPDTNGTIELY